MTSRSSPDLIRILFVCLGNVCRSPSAAGVFGRLVGDADLERRFEIDSAGTGGHFAGRAPDPRAQAAARRRGIDLSGMRARAVADRDFDRFDHIIAMDEANLRDILDRWADAGRAHVGLLLDHAHQPSGIRAIPDPYYGGPAGFERMLDLIEAGASGLLGWLSSQYDLH